MPQFPCEKEKEYLPGVETDGEGGKLIWLMKLVRFILINTGKMLEIYQTHNILSINFSY